MVPWLTSLVSPNNSSAIFLKASAASWNAAPANTAHTPLSSLAVLSMGLFNGAYQLRGIDPSSALFPSSLQASAGSNQSASPDLGMTGATTIPQNTQLFTTDNSYIAQSETTVAVNWNDANQVVGGVNDGRYFFCPALPASDCPSSWTYSLSGFTVSTDGGKTALFSNDIQGLAVSEKNLNTGGTLAACTAKTWAKEVATGTAVCGFLISWGDPDVLYNPMTNTFFYTSLAIDPITGANGIEIAQSNSQLFTSTSKCITSQTTPWINPCWSSTLAGGVPGFPSLISAPPFKLTSVFEDKDLAAVDTNPTSNFYGTVYVSWDHFYLTKSGVEQSQSVISACTSNLKCSGESSDNGFARVLSGTDPFAAFTTPATDSKGNLYVTWCNFGTATTFGPVSCRIRSSAPGGNDWGTINNVFSFSGPGTTMPKAYGLNGFATEQFRTADIPVLAAGTWGSTTTLYWAIDVCTQGDYYSITGGNTNILPADCGSSSIVATSSSNGGSTWSTAQIVSPANEVNVQPWITVDSSSGAAYLGYYTTMNDPFHHQIDVVYQKSIDGGMTWSSPTRVTSVSNEPDSDPNYYNYTVASGFGGSFSVPQYGDYFQAVAVSGKLYVLFTGDYAAALGTFRAEPFLGIVNSP